MDHSQHTPLSSHELTPETLQGATIYGANDQSVGHVSHLSSNPCLSTRTKRSHQVTLYIYD